MDQALAGKAVLTTEARPVGMLSGDVLLKDLYNGDWTAMPFGTRDVIQDALRGSNGARGFVDGPGHVLNYVNDNGAVRFLDAQAPGFELTAQQVDSTFHGYTRILRTNY